MPTPTNLLNMPVSAQSSPSLESAQPAANQPKTKAAATSQRVEITSPFQSGVAQPKQTAMQTAYDSNGFSMAQTMGILGKSATDSLALAARIQRAGNQGEISAKQAGVKALKSQISGEQMSEATKLAGAFVSAGTTAGMAYKGSRMMMELPKKTGGTEEQARRAQVRKHSTGAMLDGASKAIGQPITQGFTTADKLVGGQFQADMAKVADKQSEVDGTSFKAVSEAGKSAVDRANEAVKNVNTLIMGHIQRWGDVLGKLGG